MKKGICHVVGAGDFKAELLRVNEGDVVIACDGGYAHLMSSGLKCDYCLGDFDSLGYVPDFPDTAVLPVKKDITDMEAGIRRGRELGYSSFKLYGALGGERMSHSFANIQSAVGLVKEGYECTILDEKCSITVIHNSEREFEKKDHRHVSVFAYEAEARVEMQGFLYGKGEKITLEPCFPLGVSNEFSENKGKIKAKGTILIFFEKV